jgi:Ca2+-binding RTX toxin-like protein
MAIFVGTPGDDLFTGTAASDTFTLGLGGTDKAFGRGGNDVFDLGGALNAEDRLVGGGGYDTVNLDGDYSAGLVLAPSTLGEIEQVNFAAGNDYNITLDDGTVGAGAKMFFKGSALGAADTLTFDGSAELDGQFRVSGGQGNDTIKGGPQQNNIRGGNGDDTIMGGDFGDRLIGGDGTDNIQGGNGDDFITGGFGASDLLNGGTGADTFIYGSAAESTGPGYDILDEFDASVDKIDLNVAVSAMDQAIVTGRLDEPTYNADIAAAANSDTLQAHHAVFFTPDSGSDAGELYMIVDANGTAGYQAGADYVFEFDDGTNMGSFSTANFV